MLGKCVLKVPVSRFVIARQPIIRRQPKTALCVIGVYCYRFLSEFLNFCELAGVSAVFIELEVIRRRKGLPIYRIYYGNGNCSLRTEVRG